MNLKILIFLYHLTTLKKPPININLTYKILNNKLIHTFPFYYGNPSLNLIKIDSQIDLYFDKTILISNKITKSGIDCSQKNKCFQSQKSHFIINNNQQLIETNLTYMPLYIKNSKLEASKIRKDNLQFEIVNSNFKVMSSNIVGLNYGSSFLLYIDKFYGMDGVWFSLKTEGGAGSRKAIMEDPGDLVVGLEFFGDLNDMLSESYYFQKSECLCLKNFSIDFLGVLMSDLAGKIDINLPALMKVDSGVYSDFVKVIKSFICKNVGECFKKEHVFSGYDLNQRLNVVFKSKEKNINNMTIKIFVREMFYFDKDDFIQYNFEMNESKKSNLIIFGILFLKKVDLLIYRGKQDKRNFMIFLNQKSKKKRYYILQVIIMSFFSAFLLTFLCLKVSKPKDDKFARHSFNSFLY